MVMLLFKLGWWTLFTCVLLGYKFAKGSKIKLLRTDRGRSSLSAVSDFKRYVYGKRKEKDSNRNSNLYKDISVLLYSAQEKMKTSLEDVD